MRNNSSGNSNTGLGTFAGGANTTGNGNTAVGYYALLNSVTGSNLTVVGTQSGNHMINGNMNITLLGAYTETISGTAIQNSTAIGANAIVNTSNTIQLGDSNVTQVNTFGDFSKSGTNYAHPDYVFEKVFKGYSDYNNSYELLTLEAVESFIKKNSHLPGVQSRADIQAKNSWNVSENVRTNLEKVEKLFLHTIAQEKQIKKLEGTNKSLLNQIEKQEALLKQLIKRFERLENKK